MTKHQWKARAKQLLKEDKEALVLTSRGRVSAFYDLIKALAKADGLKSNKKRHVMKRFKIVLHRLIEEHIDASNL